MIKINTSVGPLPATVRNNDKDNVKEWATVKILITMMISPSLISIAHYHLLSSDMSVTFPNVGKVFFLATRKLLVTNLS